MPAGTSAFAKMERRGEFGEKELPLVSAVTYEPVGNPLLKATEAQRKRFFDGLARSFKPPIKENESKNSSSKVMLEKPSRLEPGSPRVSRQLYSSSYWSDLPEFRHAQEGLSMVISDYSRGGEGKAQVAMQRFESRLKEQNYKPDDLMAVLLLSIEDIAWEGKEKPEPSRPEGKGAPQAVLQALANQKDEPASPAEPKPQSPRQMAIPEILKEDARQSVQIRLASVREMLRYYFDRNPREYHRAISKVLDLDAGLPEQSESFQDALARKIAEIGSFALAQLILAEIKSYHEMDTQECLVKLGYKYDDKLRRLILGKRTCGSRTESKGIIRSILSNLKGKRMASAELPPPPKKSRLLSIRPRKRAAPG